MKKKVKHDPYRWEHAQCCVRCNVLKPEKAGGIRYQVCHKCVKYLGKQRDHWLKHGLYACQIPKSQRVRTTW